MVVMNKQPIFIPIDRGDGMNEVLTRLGLNEINGGVWAGGQFDCRCQCRGGRICKPINGQSFTKVQLAGVGEYEQM